MTSSNAPYESDDEITIGCGYWIGGSKLNDSKERNLLYQYVSGNAVISRYSSEDSLVNKVPKSSYHMEK